MELVATISPLDNACLLEMLFEHAFCNQSADDACNEGHNSDDDYHCSIHKAVQLRQILGADTIRRELLAE